MLMLLVEFPDRLAADAEAPYADAAPYLDFLRQGMAEWFALSSYGHLQFSLVSPQFEKKLGWILMGKKAADYDWGGLHGRDVWVHRRSLPESVRQLGNQSG